MSHVSMTPFFLSRFAASRSTPQKANRFSAQMVLQTADTLAFARQQNLVQDSFQPSHPTAFAPRFAGANAQSNKYGLDPELLAFGEILSTYLAKDYREKLFPKMQQNLANPQAGGLKDGHGKVDARKVYAPVIQAIRELGGELGAMGIDTPEEWGGMGLGTIASSELCRRLGYEDSGLATSVLVSTGTGLFGKPILIHGTDEQRVRYLPEVINGEKIGAFALTEPDSGSDAGAMKTTATKMNGKWHLSGSKTFITNGNIADYMVVLARTVDPNAGIGMNPDRPVISAFIVHRDDLNGQGKPGLTTQHIDKLGQNVSDTALVYLDDIVLGDDRLVGGEAGIGIGKEIYNKTLVGGRIGVAAMSAGVAERALDLAIEYAKTRKQFDSPFKTQSVVSGQQVIKTEKEPLAAKPGIANKLVDMAIQVEVSKLLAYDAARLKDDSDVQAAAGGVAIPFTKAASIAKLFASEAANQVAYNALQIHGGNGFASEYPISKIYRDARVLPVYEGTSEIQKLIISREIMRELMNEPSRLHKALIENSIRIKHFRTLDDVVNASYELAENALVKAYFQEDARVRALYHSNIGAGLLDINLLIANNLQDKLMSFANLVMIQQGLKVLREHVESLESKGFSFEKENGMLAVFSNQAAHEALRLSMELSGDTVLMRKTSIQTLLARSANELRGQYETVAGEIL